MRAHERTMIGKLDSMTYDSEFPLHAPGASRRMSESRKSDHTNSRKYTILMTHLWSRGYHYG